MFFRALMPLLAVVSLALPGSLVISGAPADADVAARSTATAVETVLQEYRPDSGNAGRCDVYLPTDAPPANGFPAVVVIHGGGWIGGDKWTMGNYCQNLAREGFVAVSINYRLAPEFKFPAQVDDVREALVWLASQRERLHIDTDRMGLFGYSAGGHLAALIGLLGDASAEEQAATTTWPMDDARWKQLPVIKAVCVGGPPCDFCFLPQDNTAMAFFLGGSRRELPEVYRAASPITHISAADPPVQLIHGEKDLVVPFASSREMLAALRSAGVDSQLTAIPDQGHMLTFVHPKTNESMLKFFRRTLDEPSAKSQSAQ